MPADMKELIAGAAWTLLTERRVKKLTVKDIVEQCHITRQAFYYHFEDIPELFRWMIEKNTARTLQKVLSCETAEEGLRCLFVMCINYLPFIRQGMDSNYGAELSQLLHEYIQRFYVLAAESAAAYPDCSPAEARFIFRYHSQAILGLFQDWTDDDTEHLDDIVRMVYRLITQGVPPAKTEYRRLTIPAEV